MLLLFKSPPKQWRNKHHFQTMVYWLLSSLTMMLFPGEVYYSCFIIILCLMIWSLMGTLTFNFIVTDFPVRNSCCSPKTSMNKCLLSGVMRIWVCCRAQWMFSSWWCSSKSIKNMIDCKIVANLLLLWDFTWPKLVSINLTMYYSCSDRLAGICEDCYAHS